MADFDLNSESVHRTYIASATSRFTAWVAKRATTARAPSFSRQTVIAVCALLILAFALVARTEWEKRSSRSSGNTSLASAEVRAAVPSNLVSQGTVQPVSKAPTPFSTANGTKAEGTNSSNSASQPRQAPNYEQPRESNPTELWAAELRAAVSSNLVSQETVQPVSKAPMPLSTANGIKAEGTNSSKSAPQPRQRRIHEQPRVSNPTELWAQVRKQNSDAAVELARMYLEGTNVAQNCQQAQVLLLAASRKGNSRANELLTEFSNQCH